MSVQRGDLVAGRYRTGEPLGPAWRAHDETGGGTEVLLVPVAPPGEAGAEAAAPDPLNTDRWRDRPGTPPVTATATGDAGAWLVTQPVAARTLSDAVAQWGALPAEQVLLIAAGATTTLSANGPRISAAPDHILLTDDGQVLLLPIETTENDLPTLGASLHLAAEGHPATEAGPGPLRQPQLTALITGLTQPDSDRASTLDRTFAELSRLGAPLATVHGTDTLHEAQAASAAADAVDNDDADATQPIESSEVPTQTMSATELLAETGENEVEAAAEDDDTAEAEAEADEDAEADDAATRQVPVIAADEVPAPEAETASLESPSADEAATRQVPLVVADAVPASDSETATLESPADETATRQVPLVAAAPDTDSTTTRQVPTLDLESAAAAIPTDSTEEIPSPDDSATKSLPLPAVASAEPTPNPFVAPTQAAEAVPPIAQAMGQQPVPPVPPTQA
ncbi:hypothetical protein, partial [Catenulispora rubra]|uniref:hypothetical protein n=1 Tax=Catenulispora rubra TaxID=280293 RepID=UPI003F6A03B7